MAGNQTLVGAGPAIAVFWYQGHNTTGKRDKTICCEIHQIIPFYLTERFKILNMDAQYTKARKEDAR